MYYTNTIAPTAIKLLTVSYYDNYNYPNVSPPASEIELEPVSTAVKGLLTGQWLKVYGLNNSMTGNVVNHYYDKKSREIGSYTTRYASGGYITVKSKLDFTGKPLYTTHQHRRATGATVYGFTDTYSYTPEDRPAYHTHKMNIGPGGTEQVLALNSYDKLGQLIGKKVGGTNTAGTDCFQHVNYSYNIRGWMTGINDVTDLTKDGDPADLFAFKLNYGTPEQDLNGVAGLFNGNISETYWRTGNDDVLRMYGYQYDGLNRLTDAHYAKHTGSSLVDVDSFRESLFYNKNGNITHLGRNGGMDLSDEAIEIDDMTYTYDSTKPNQLVAVDDESNKNEGFKDVTNTVDYVYDANGNLTKDFNKGIGTSTTDGIIYNHLNLPMKITFANGDKIEYFYQADGVKVQKVVTQGSTVTTTDYIDGIQYTNNVLDFVPTAEGYVKNTVVGSTNTFSYVYNYTDHLGNVRLSYAKSPGNVLTILEENNYYPFGMKHQGYNNDGYSFGSVSNALALVFNGAKTYRYQYNGKEFQGELGLDWSDYGARNYDPAIGRWMNMDPLAETSRRFSPYAYALNNPVYFIDPDGMEAAGSVEDLETDIGYGRKVNMNSNVSAVNHWDFGNGIGADSGRGDGDSTIVTEKNGKYVVTGGKADKDNGVYLDDGKGGKGKKIGSSRTAHSFLDDAGNPVEGAIIDPKSKEAQEFIDQTNKENPSLAEYVMNATEGEKYDFKNKNIASRPADQSERQFQYRGSMDSSGHLISARDAGNFEAGYIGGRAGLSWSTFRLACDALETYQQSYVGRGIGNKPIIVIIPSVESPTTQKAQAVGFMIGYYKYHH